MPSEPDVLRHIKPHLLRKQPYQDSTELHAFTEVIDIEWDSQCDIFHLATGKTPSITILTKRVLVSEIAKIYDVLGWFGPTIIKPKILYQRL